MKLSAKAREMFRKVGAAGGKARAKKMTAAQREQSARKAARARWSKRKAK